jgi:alkanesulfonate monooxygenase SsuD/methylene tetrahydromethanopterin reductase-like flavin-dependent oxidoreductase (luciferase family)
MPAYDRAADGLRTEIPVYVGATGPWMQKLAGKESDGMLLAGLTSPAFVRYALDNMKKGAATQGRTLPGDFPVGGVILCSCSEDGDKARDATRSYTGTYIVNKIRNIKNDVILAGSGLPDESWEPFRKAIADVVDAGLNLPLLEVVGESEEYNLEVIRLMGEHVVPNLKPGPALA